MIEHIQEKLMIKFFFKFKKALLAHFPILWGKKSFSEKSTCHAQLIRVSCTMLKFRETNYSIPTKQPTRQQDGRMDRPYFIGSFRLLPGVQQVQLQYNWHFKVKDIEYDVGLIKDYCLTVSMQKKQLNSSIHSLDIADFRGP